MMRTFSALILILLLLAAACQSGGDRVPPPAAPPHDFKWIAYDPSSRTLALQFNDGSRSNFQDVAESVYAELMHTSGKMAFYTNSIQTRYASKPGE